MDTDERRENVRDYRDPQHNQTGKPEIMPEGRRRTRRNWNEKDREKTPVEQRPEGAGGHAPASEPAIGD